jgi:hypothetical protein
MIDRINLCEYAMNNYRRRRYHDHRRGSKTRTFSNHTYSRPATTRNHFAQAKHHAACVADNPTARKGLAVF